MWNDRQKRRQEERQARSDQLRQRREELWAGGWDASVHSIYYAVTWVVELNPLFSLLIASEYEPLAILERLQPYLAGSATIVVHSPHLQVRSFCACQ